MRRRFLPTTLATVALSAAIAAQARPPVPSPFPGAPTPPASATPRAPAPSAPPPTRGGQPAAQAPASAAAAKPAPAAVPSGPSLPGVPLYPTAEYLETVDAGSGQHYYLYGTDVPFADIVSYYRTVMKNGGREIYRTPAMHQFDLGRFNEERMVYPPSVVVKDYSGTTTPGYLHVVGTTEKRFRTVIQIVPAAPQ